MAVKMNNANVSINIGGRAANIGIADGMIAAKHDGEDAAFGDIADGKGDLVKAFLDVGGNDLHIANVYHVQRFAQINAPFRVVAIAKRGDAPHGFGSETSS